MNIRRAIPGDIPAIAEVGRATWPSTYAFAGPAYIAHGLATWWSASAVARSLDTTVVLVADSGQGLAGTGNIDLRGPVPIIRKLYVTTPGAGVGSQLLTELIRVAGDRPVRLEYTDGNDRAARFYTRHGFVEQSRDPGERPGWPETVWMERPAGG